MNRLTARNETDVPATVRVAFFPESSSLGSVGVGRSHRTTSNKKTYYRLNMFSSKLKNVKIQVTLSSFVLTFIFLPVYLYCFKVLKSEPKVCSDVLFFRNVLLL